jgi:CDP-diacylglycerol--serine O-phosphatidyltransferase
VKKIAIVPTLLTLGNGICGFAAIACASKIGNESSIADNDFWFFLSGWLIVAAMIFDGFDGYVARISNSASKFGGELDSLCDAVSFGVAPAFLILKMGPGWEPRPLLHQILAGVATLYMVCTILRLARFNVDNTPDPAAHKRFRGLPSPAAAGCIASLAILRGGLPNKLVQIEYFSDIGFERVHQIVDRIVEVSAPIGALLVALLMVSIIPYARVTKQVLRGRRRISQLIQVLLAAFIIFLAPEFALALLFWVYAIGVPVRYVWLKNLKRVPAPRLDDIRPQ